MPVPLHFVSSERLKGNIHAEIRLFSLRERYLRETTELFVSERLSPTVIGIPDVGRLTLEMHEMADRMRSFEKPLNKIEKRFGNVPVCELDELETSIAETGNAYRRLARKRKDLFVERHSLELWSRIGIPGRIEFLKQAESNMTLDATVRHDTRSVLQPKMAYDATAYVAELDEQVAAVMSSVTQKTYYVALLPFMRNRIETLYELLKFRIAWNVVKRESIDSDAAIGNLETIRSALNELAFDIHDRLKDGSDCFRRIVRVWERLANTFGILAEGRRCLA